jgi:hypothetical protein
MEKKITVTGWTFVLTSRVMAVMAVVAVAVVAEIVPLLEVLMASGEASGGLSAQPSTKVVNLFFFVSYVGPK